MLISDGKAMEAYVHNVGSIPTRDPKAWHKLLHVAMRSCTVLDVLEALSHGSENEPSKQTRCREPRKAT